MRTRDRAGRAVEVLVGIMVGDARTATELGQNGHLPRRRDEPQSR